MSILSITLWRMQTPFSRTCAPSNYNLCYVTNICRREIQAKFVDERNWHQYHTPRNVLLAMVGEVGELSEIL